MFERDEREACFRGIITSLERAVMLADCLIEFPEMNIARIEVIEALDGIVTRIRATDNRELDEALEELIKRISKL